jgi:hypothetical protein
MAGNGHSIHYGSKAEKLGPLSANSPIRAQQLAIGYHKEVPLLPFDGV